MRSEAHSGCVRKEDMFLTEKGAITRKGPLGLTLCAEIPISSTVYGLEVKVRQYVQSG